MLISKSDVNLPVMVATLVLASSLAVVIRIRSGPGPPKDGRNSDGAWSTRRWTEFEFGAPSPLEDERNSEQASLH